MQWWTWIALAVVILMAVLRKWKNTAAGKIALDEFLLNLPFWGSFLLKAEMARFCRTLELLLKSGISIVRALQIGVPVIGNGLLRTELQKCQDDLVAGSSLSESLKKIRGVPVLMVYLISVGEESGSLSGTLQDIAQNYEMETNETVKFLTTMLEPLMIIVVGSLIGFIAIAMLLPVFQLDVFAR